MLYDHYHFKYVIITCSLSPTFTRGWAKIQVWGILLTEVIACFTLSKYRQQASVSRKYSISWAYLSLISSTCTLSLWTCRRWQNEQNEARWAHQGGRPTPPWGHLGHGDMAWSKRSMFKPISTIGSNMCFYSMVQDEKHMDSWVHTETKCNHHHKTCSMTCGVTKGEKKVGQPCHRGVGRPRLGGPWLHYSAWWHQHLLEAKWWAHLSLAGVGRPQGESHPMSVACTCFTREEIKAIHPWRLLWRFDPMAKEGEHADRWRGTGVAATPPPSYKYPLELFICMHPSRESLLSSFSVRREGREWGVPRRSPDLSGIFSKVRLSGCDSSCKCYIWVLLVFNILVW